MKNLFFMSLSGRNLTIAFASFVVLLTTLGILFFEGSKKTVAITLNGEQKVVNTHADTVKELFDELDVSLRSQDYLFPKANAKVKDHLKVVWKQAKQVSIVKDNEKKTIWTTAGTVAELLKEQKIVLNAHDQISPNPEAAIQNKLRVGIKKAFNLTYVDKGKAQQVWTTSTTVADFLTQQGIKLNSLDRVEPTLTESVKENGVVNVIRVEKVTDVVEEPVEFAVVTKKDEGLEKGKEKILSAGKHGRVSRQYEVLLENGKEVSRKLLSEQMIAEKQDKVVAVGTKELSLQVSRGAVETGKEFYVTATAYTANCNGCSGRTATGLNLRANPNMKVIAVDPRIIPLGTKVYVEGYGYAVAADTGGAIKGYIIDVFVPSNADAYRWGRKKVKIKILQ
ncbi:ubiquitin-like domain-containing protein [Paenibacillus sp. BSR1-1]|uniref:G5 and 3D domain-containing protein n=1 Tax=Paenibacillus sp. BSR1-1 TaxID=3020845 RepID=UPI0025AFF32B|nr:G5 and 3D domain-containing protein [Paenibacillus sp. BSR1-1]MDN3020001.1 ubiquitin-like domain-containing protein [Paenibacillus sp. BSR1-1]